MSVRVSAQATAVETGVVEIVGTDGSRTPLRVRGGARLMPELRAAKVGVIGMCGGSGCCGTCHVYVDPEWSDRLPSPGALERDMLDELESATDRSRLACQITMSGELDGVVMTVAPHE